MPISGSSNSIYDLTAAVSGSGYVSGEITSEVTVTGSVAEISTISGELSSTYTISGSVSETGTVTGTITVGGVTDYPEYEGPYEVVPTVEAQTLETAYTLLTDDVTVTAVPYYQVSNVSGDTVYIASEA